MPDQISTAVKIFYACNVINICLLHCHRSLDPLPSPSQMAELRLRFQDSVQILLAVVMPDSIAFYTFGSVCLPVDDTSYKI